MEQTLVALQQFSQISRYFWLGFTPEWKQLTFRTKSIIINHSLINLQHIGRKRCNDDWSACLKSERCFPLNLLAKYLPTMYLIVFKPILNLQMQIVLKMRSIELASIGQDQVASDPDQKTPPATPIPMVESEDQTEMKENNHRTHHLPQRSHVQLQPQRNHLRTHNKDYGGVQHHLPLGLISLSTLTPPMFMKVMPYHNPYPAFVFFGLYGLINLIHMIRYLRESDLQRNHQKLRMIFGFHMFDFPSNLSLIFSSAYLLSISDVKSRMRITLKKKCYVMNTLFMQIHSKPVLNIQMQIELKTTSIELVSIGQDQAASIPNEQDAPINPDAKGTPSKPNPPEQKVRIKHLCRIIMIGLIITISALICGYALKDMTSVPIKKIVQEYKITSLDPSTAQSILIGILPIGSILGSILTKYLIKRYRRLTGIYIFTVVNILGVILININSFASLIVGRFIEGVCVGYYSAISPMYLREIAPKELRKKLGLLFSLGKVVGVLVIIAMELSFHALEVDLGWRVILSMTAIFSILQAILIYFFGSDTPTEMIEKGEKEKAKKIIQEFYYKEYVEEVLNQYQQEYDAEQAKGHQVVSEDSSEVDKAESKPNQTIIELVAWQNDSLVDLNGSPQKSLPILSNQLNPIPHSRKTIIDKQDNRVTNSLQLSDSKDSKQKTIPKKLTYEDKKSYAFCLCLHLCVIRNFIGGNAIVSQGGLFVSYFDPNIGSWTTLIINSIKFVFILIGLFYVQKLTGKRPLFILSMTLLSLTNFTIAIAMIYENVPAIQTLLCVYMMVYGGGFVSPIWAYPSEIVPASESLMPNIFHWVTLSLSTLIPPLVMKAMPHHNPYPIFLFFGFYGVVGLIHVVRYLRESDGLTYKQIIKSFG